MLTPLPDECWPPILEELRSGFAGRLNVYRTMAHHPALVKAWAPFREHIVAQTSLGSVKSEIVILRIGHRWHSEYEWAHHVVRARTVGLSKGRIESIRGPLGEMEPEDAILAAAVDILMDRGALIEPSLSRLSNLVGATGVLDLMATVGMYSTLAFVVNTFNTPIDRDVMAALAEM